MRNISALFLALMLSATALAAAPGDVVINEVAWMGTSVTADEWIELYNNTLADVDLDGWTIVDDGGAQPYTISTASCAGGSCVIPAGGYFLIEEREEATSEPSNLIVNLNLGNTGDSLDLHDGADASIDMVDCSAAWFAGDNGDDRSMERYDPSLGGNYAINWGNYDTSVATYATDAGGNPINGTPGRQNSVFGSPPGPAIIHVHCLDAASIDVYFDAEVDQTSAETATNYVLNAGAADINPATAARDTTDLTIVHLTGIAGLADGDLATLATSGVEDNDLQIAGNSSAEFFAGVVSVAFVRADTDGNYVPDLLGTHAAAFFTVHVTVTAVKRFYYAESFVQDATGGLAIFDQPTSDGLARGDEILLSGLLDQYDGKDEIVDTRFSLLSQGNPLSVAVLTLAQLAANPEAYENMLIGIATVSDTTGGDAWPASGSDANIEVSDDAGVTNYVMYIDKDTGIPGNPEPIYPVNIIGIGWQYSMANPPADSYSVAPRDMADIGVADWPDGTTRPCYSGPAGTAGFGICHAGTETYTAGAWSGNCIGEVTPAANDDQCDGVDDNCDGTPDDGSDLTLATRCGACDNDCTVLPNVANPSCNTAGASPVCAFDCQTGYGDCTGDPGCETPIGTLDNCSACGDACVFDNAAGSTCTADACVMVCDAVFDDCENGTTDGCEASLSSTATCGDCNTACVAGELCVNPGGGYECSSTCTDTDSDGHADESCGGDDCDDSDKLVYPGATELCDTVDNDCDTETDEDFVTLGQACDSDNDPDLCPNGTFVCNPAQDGVVCDGDVAAVEACNGLDDDCDGQTDEDWPELGQACDGTDDDLCLDGHMICSQAGNGLSCDDDDDSNEELCNNTDDNCDGQIDEGFDTYTCGKGVCEVTVDVCVDGAKQECVATTNDPRYEPAAELSCDDGVDNDCDGFVDLQDLDCSKKGGGGCGCSSSERPHPALFGLLLAALGLALRRRRRT
ncbi:MAG TPA: lamin tail domain-containing protein [Myxococcota bacterium]|nr:lamin tail domain-containing protein [Myxococcota bacterium]